MPVGERAANIYSLIGTCLLNGIEPYHYLRKVLERIPEHPINRIEQTAAVESRRKDTRAALGRIAATAESLARIEAILDAGGQIMLGTLPPVEGAAVAHDGKKTVAMLRRRPNESIAQLLTRLDEAIGKAKAAGQRVDEINANSTAETYEIANPALGRRVNAAPKK